MSRNLKEKSKAEGVRLGQKEKDFINGLARKLNGKAFELHNLRLICFQYAEAFKGKEITVQEVSIFLSGQMHHTL